MIAVAGTGSALPPQRVPSSAFDARHGLAKGTVELALGVRERRVAAADVAASDLAVEACGKALEAAGGASVGLLLLATSTPDHITPATAPLVAHRLGLSCAASDVANTCSGWIYALSMAERWLAGEPDGTCAVVAAANVLSRRVDWTDWRTAGLFGDGAGAVVLRRVEEGGILASSLASDGAGYHRIQVPAGGSRVPLTPERVGAREHLLRINGVKLEDSLGLLCRTAEDALAKAGLAARDVDRFVPHQANAKLMLAATDRLGIPRERLVANLAAVGNLSAASIPVALDEAAREGRLRDGHVVLMSVVAGGMTAGSVVLRWGA